MKIIYTATATKVLKITTIIKANANKVFYHSATVIRIR